MAAAPTLISLVVGVLVASLFAASAAFLFLVVEGVVNGFLFPLFLSLPFSLFLVIMREVDKVHTLWTPFFFLLSRSTRLKTGPKG